MLTLAVPSGNASGEAKVFAGGWASCYMTGTFNSATCKLQASDDGTNYFDLTDEMGNAAQLTANGRINFHLGGPVSLRITNTGSGGSTVVVCQVRFGVAGVASVGVSW